MYQYNLLFDYQNYSHHSSFIYIKCLQFEILKDKYINKYKIYK